MSYLFKRSRRLAVTLTLISVIVVAGCDDDDDPIVPTTEDLIETLEAEGFSTLLLAIEEAGLTETLRGAGPFTVFAPTDEAFENLPEGALDELLADTEALETVLLYHVVPGRITTDDLDDEQILTTVEERPVRVTLEGEVAKVNRVDVVEADIEAENGVIHSIGAVLTPVEDNVDTAIQLELNTLVTAIQEAGLEETLRGEGPFTIFAPTDEAFDELPEGTLEELLGDPEALANVLTYHVVDGRFFAADLEDGMELETLQGGTVTISIGEEVGVNDAAVTEADVLTSNGVIHVINAVLNPEEE
jgi:transforming growth factor-beta-induced protein